MIFESICTLLLEQKKSTICKNELMAARLELCCLFLRKACQSKSTATFHQKAERERDMGVQMELAEPCSLSVTRTINQRIAGANVDMQGRGVELKGG